MSYFDDKPNEEEPEESEESEESEEEIEVIDDDIDDEEPDEEVIDDDEDNELQQGGGDGEDDELEEGEIDEAKEQREQQEKENKKIKKILPSNQKYKEIIEDNTDDDDDDGENYLQKFDSSVNNNYILNFHPESIIQNYDEILSMTKVVRNQDGIIVDKLHRTIPYLTKYEKARILGQRAKQINSGAYPFVKVPENVIDGYIVAEIELQQKRIPFIIRRPLPNGGSEYWKVQDLEDVSF